MYKLLLEDYSHLGGPMGSEYTTVMEEKFYEDEDKALEQVWRWLKTHNSYETDYPKTLKEWNKLSKKKRRSFMGDRRNVGISLRKIKLNG